MPDLLTFVFTDLAGSVEWKRLLPGADSAQRDEAYVRLVLSPHRERIEQGLAEAGGRIVSTAGDGHFLVFGDAARAAQWAIAVQQAHHDFRPLPAVIDAPAARVRIGLHVGAPQVDPKDAANYIGRAVDYAARLLDFAAAGQTLASRSAAALVEDAGLRGVRLVSHGPRQLRGIGDVELFELVAEGASPTPPRRDPRHETPRAWTVLAPTMGLTEYSDSARPMTGAAAVASAPSRIGNYQIEALVGSGGMGNVYRARHALFGKVRAVKVIRPELVAGGGEAVVRRFYQEVRAVGQLEHPNLVVAIDSSTPDDEQHYLVMEFVEGVSLDRLVAERGPMAVADACEAARQAALGLAHLHQCGLVHRDVKPSNLMLTLAPATDPTGAGSAAPGGGRAAVVKLLDLGLALLVGRDQQRLTRFDQGAMGTAFYMAPEQWRSTSVDIRADIYSLGCTLHHLLTGAPPFADSELRPDVAHEREAPPPLPERDGFPPALERLVRSALAKRPEDRPQTPAEFAAALAPLAAGNHLAETAARVLAAPRRGAAWGSETRLAPQEGIDTRRPGPRHTGPAPAWTRRSWWGVAAALVATAAAIGFGLVADRRRERIEADRRAELVRTSRFAASQMAEQVDKRFRALRSLAEDSELSAWLVAVDKAPDDESLWAPIQNWIDSQKGIHDEEFRSNSWFVTDRRGVQVARSPRSGSIGESYAYRDYFHGRGRDTQDDSQVEAPAEGDKTPPAPLTEPHQSSVYVSTSSGDLKVAFSVPVWNGARAQGRREVVGVLAMSVSLGEFDALSEAAQNARPIEIVLVDRDADYVQGKRGEGLVLHHSGQERRVLPALPARLPEEMLRSIDSALDAGVNPSHRLLTGYQDVLARDGGKYLGAFAPVVVQTPGQTRDTGWVILAQEPLRR